MGEVVMLGVTGNAFFTQLEAEIEFGHHLDAPALNGEMLAFR